LTAPDTELSTLSAPALAALAQLASLVGRMEAGSSKSAGADMDIEAQVSVLNDLASLPQATGEYHMAPLLIPQADNSSKGRLEGSFDSIRDRLPSS
jgi:hypothetical protein